MKLNKYLVQKALPCGLIILIILSILFFSSLTVNAEKLDTSSPITASNILENDLTEYTFLSIKARNSSVNIRSGPGLEYSTASFTLPNATSLNLIEKTNNDWWKVSALGLEGYVSTAYIHEEVLQIPSNFEVLSFCTTNFSYTELDRQSNLRRASELLSTVKLPKGESISIGNLLQPFTYENGYLKGPSFSEGKTLYSIGGGICQASSTIYSAALDVSQITINTRFRHGKPVDYIAYVDRDGNLERDATIWLPSKDLILTANEDLQILSFADSGFYTVIIVRLK